MDRPRPTHPTPPFNILTSLTVVDECVKRLVAGGFTELKEKEVWKMKPLGKVRITFNVSGQLRHFCGGVYMCVH